MDWLKINGWLKNQEVNFAPLYNWLGNDLPITNVMCSFYNNYIEYSFIAAQKREKK